VTLGRVTIPRNERFDRAACCRADLRVTVVMRPLLISLPAVSIAMLLFGCDRPGDSIPVPGDPPEKTPVPSAGDASTVEPEKAPALTEAAIEGMILDALTPIGDDTAVASADPKKFSIHNLPEAQQETLNEALQQAVSKIDFQTLLSSLANNLDLANLPANANVSTRVLTPEEVKKMGIDFKGLTSEDGDGEAPGSLRVGNVQVITIGEGKESPLSILQGEGPETGAAPASAEMSVTRITPIEVTEENDPERAARFQALLESGDSNALAGEIAELIQNGIDAATLQQAMGGGVEDQPAPGE